MKTRRDRQLGATFIEVLSAVGVFSLVAVGLSPALLSTRTMADLGKNRTIATTLANDKVEHLRTLPAGSLANGSDGPLDANGAAGGIFTRSWTVAPNTPINGVSRVVTTVTWRDRSGVNMVQLVALVMP